MTFKTIKEISINNKGYYGIGASSCDYNSSFPSYLRITDISDDGNVKFPLETCVDTSLYPDWQKYLLKMNDLVFARTGNSTGRNYFCKYIDRPTVFAGFLIKFSIDPKAINPRYVGYYCQSTNYWNQIKSLFTGSTRANVNAEQYALLKIPIVDSHIQQHIVNTTSSLLLKSL